MSYYNQQEPPVGVPPFQGYPQDGYPKDAYPIACTAESPRRWSPQQQQSKDRGCLEECLAALCCCCLLDACF